MRAPAIALSCLLFAGAPAAAATDRYDVEVVVFERTQEGSAAGERWQATVTVPRFERARLLDQMIGLQGTLEDEPTTGFEPLRAREGTLAPSVRRLEEHEDYEVLQHLRWRQPALGRDESIPVRVRAGRPMRLEGPKRLFEEPIPSAGNRPATADAADAPAGDAAPDADTAAGADSDADVDEGETAAGTGDQPGGQAGAEPEPGDEADMGPAPRRTGQLGDLAYLGPDGSREREAEVYPLDGTIEVAISRYIHVHANLYRTAAVDWQGAVAAGPEQTQAGEDAAGDGEPAAGEPQDEQTAQDAFSDSVRGPNGDSMLTFPMRQSRRMRSDRLHYIDHPRLGILVIVTPYEEEEASDSEAGSEDEATAGEGG